MAYKKEIGEYQQRTHRALEMGGEHRVARRRQAGRMAARQRVDYLFDAGSFLEIGRLARSERREDWDSTPADGKVCGHRRIAGREAAVVFHDITVKRASSAVVNVKKMGHMRRTAQANVMPLVLLNESSGASIPDTMGAASIGALGQDTQAFHVLPDHRQSGIRGEVVGQFLDNKVGHGKLTLRVNGTCGLSR